MGDVFRMPNVFRARDVPTDTGGAFAAAKRALSGLSPSKRVMVAQWLLQDSEADLSEPMQTAEPVEVWSDARQATADATYRKRMSRQG